MPGRWPGDNICTLKQQPQYSSKNLSLIHTFTQCDGKYSIRNVAANYFITFRCVIITT